MPEKFDLSEKVAVITGGAGLLGKQHASALAEISVIVIITDIDENAARLAAEDIDKTYGPGRVFPMAMDVTDPSSIQNVNDTLQEDHGGVHILKNNAAIDPKVSTGQGLKETSSLENFSLKQWQFQIDVGLSCAYFGSQVFGVRWQMRTVGSS